MLLSSDYKEFLKLMNEHEVEYLLIGGYAVGYQGNKQASARLKDLADLEPLPWLCVV